MGITMKKILGPKNIGSLNRTKNLLLGGLFGRNLNILIDTTNGCNLHCIFCTRENNEVIRMTTEAFDGILAKIHTRVRALQLCCAWEYTIAKNAPEIVAVLGKYPIPRTTIYSHGNILSDPLAEAVVASPLTHYVFSIGEADKETYERVRVGGRFEKILTNIERLATLKKKKNSLLPSIGINLTVIESTIRQLPEFIPLVHKLGVQEIRGRHMILNEPLDNDDEIIRDYDEANRILDTAEKQSSALGLRFNIPRFVKTPEKKACIAPWDQLYISSNGDVAVCPRTHVYEKIGNLVQQELPEILSGQALKQLRWQFFRKQYANPVCETCLTNREHEIPINQGF